MKPSHAAVVELTKIILFYFKNCEFTRNAIEIYRIDTHKGAILVHTAGSGIISRGRDNRLQLVGNIFKNHGNTGQIRELGSVGSSWWIKL